MVSLERFQINLLKTRTVPPIGWNLALQGGSLIKGGLIREVPLYLYQYCKDI